MVEGSKFTWFPKLTSTVEKIPEEHRGAFLWALARYGTYGVEPELAWPMDAIFEGLREDIDNSKRSIASGRRGGKGKSNGGSETAEPPFGESETPLGENEKGGSGKSQAIPNQSSPIHTSTRQGKGGARFSKPSPDEVAGYASEIGFPAFDAQRFCDYYGAQGWKLSNGNVMKDWKAAVRNWARKDGPKGGGRYAEYD